MNDIISVINTLADSMYKAVEKDVFKVLDKLLFIDKSILEAEPFKKLSFSSDSNNVILLALCFTTMFAICFVIKKIISMYTLKESNTWLFILKVVICTILALSSYYICETVLDINQMISNCLNNIGEEITGEKIQFETLKNMITDFGEEGFISLDGAIKGMVGFGAVSLLLNFSVRYVTIIFLIIISPIAFMLIINTTTFDIFAKWAKLLITNLLIQNFTSIIITIPLCIKDTESVTFKVLLVGSIYMLYKINGFVADVLSNLNFRR